MNKGMLQQHYSSHFVYFRCLKIFGNIIIELGRQTFLTYYSTSYSNRILVRKLLNKCNKCNMFDCY